MKAIWASIVAFWTHIFTRQPAAVTAPKPSPPPPEPKFERITPQEFERILRDDAVRYAEEDLSQSETHGKNRSPFIDDLNRKVGEKLGSAYCASGLTVRVIDRVCSKYSLKNPVGLTSSSQAIAARVPQKFWRQYGEKAKKGDAHVETQRGVPHRGHTGLVSADMTDAKIYNAIDYNSNAKGDRDGEGVDRVVRTIAGDSEKFHKCFVNWIGFVIERNADRVANITVNKETS